MKNRLEAIKLKKSGEGAYQELLLRRGIGSGNSASLGKSIQTYYAQSGLEISAVRRVMYLVALFILGYVLTVAFVTSDAILSLVGAFIFTLLVAVAIVVRARSSRIKKFTQQLAPAIDIIVRSLNAGHPLNSAIALVAREMPDPIGSEFGILSDQMTFGSDLDEAMLLMIKRVGAPELELLATTVSVQRGTGGNLSEILENLAQMIRGRLMIKAKIRAISAEGRFTMWFMLAFPFFLFAMIRFLKPTYFDPVWESGYAGLWITTCLIIMAIGGLIIRKIVNFDF